MLSALLIESCTKGGSAVEDDRVPVEFMQESVVVTRGVEGNGYFLSGDAFGIMAYYVPHEDELVSHMPSAKPDFMYNTKVSYDGGVWSYSPIMYWPQKDGACVNFYAYFPYSPVSGDNGITVSSSGHEGYPSFDFELGQSADVDLLVAEATACTAEDGPVALGFRHLLSKVQFKFKVSNEGGFSYVVNQIKVKDVPQTGTYTWPEVDIEFNSSPVVDVVAGGGHGDYLIDTTLPVLIDDFTIYLPPGSFGKMEVTLNNELPQIIDYSDLILLPGKILTITMEIGLTGIQYTTAVTDWVNGGTATGDIS